MISDPVSREGTDTAGDELRSSSIATAAAAASLFDAVDDSDSDSSDILLTTEVSLGVV